MSAIEWLIGGPDDGMDTLMWAEAKRASIALPRDMADLVRGLRESRETCDTDRLVDLRDLAYQLLWVRDLLEDLHEKFESVHSLFSEEVLGALIQFDTGLDELDAFMHRVGDPDDLELICRRELGDKPENHGRRWWNPRVKEE